MKKRLHFTTIILIFVSIMLLAMPVSAAVKINRTSVSMAKGKSVRLKVTGANNVIWSSSNRSVATVSKTGVVRAKNSGICKIRAKAGRKTLTCKVSVYHDAIYYGDFYGRWSFGF